ncbi:MAG: D-alanyl-D-alanine carboxypeptidase family protein [Gammaproteobacteria bacterium]
MDRRSVLGYLSVIGIFGFYGNRFLSPKATDSKPQTFDTPNKTRIKPKQPVQTILVETPPKIETAVTSREIQVIDNSVVDYLYKIKHFNKNFKTDIFLNEEKFFVLKRLSRRLNRAQTIIGYMNFSILDFPMLMRYSKNYPAIGKFTDSEVGLIEELITRTATDYGFFGDKLIDNMNDKIPKQYLSKISNSGQYLYKHQAQRLFKRIQNEVGDQVILTSGVRGLMKQLQLFTAKAVKTGGNLSRASRSLAPPGHSYHGIGDFDIGDISLGKLNFTETFSETSIYKKLVDLGFIKIRYDSNNKFGVRYEPWHIKVS